MRIPLAFALVLSAAGCAFPGAPAVGGEPWYPERDGGRPLHGVFEGRVPCLEPERRGCEKTKVGLAIYEDPRSGVPSTYRLARIDVAEEPEGARSIVAGSLTVTRGTRLDPSAPVYQLDANAPPELRAHWAIGPDILFVLDAELRPRVGTASWSWCLNRVR